jgi:hypothetical protein
VLDEVGWGGDAYADMLMEVYPEAKSADPNAQILIGGLQLDCNHLFYGYPHCLDTLFLRGILARGGGPHFAGVASHSYDYYLNIPGSYANDSWQSSWASTGPSIAAKADFLRSELGAFTDKYLINLESGLLCDPTWGHTCESDFETTKAYYLAKAFAMVVAEDIVGSVWYGLEYSFVTPTSTRNTNLLDIDRNPLPAYFTYQFASGFLNGATSDSDYSGDPNVTGYILDRDGTEVWVIWSLDGNPHGITIPMPSAIYEIGSDGRPDSLTPSTSVTVTRAPVFIEY